MLIYNLFVFTVAILLYLDYVVSKNNIGIVHGTKKASSGGLFLYLALALMIFFAGFRLEIGYDYPKYIAGYLYDGELGKWEPLFNFLVRLSRNFDFEMNGQLMFLFFSALTFIILYKALRLLTPYYRMGLFLYVLIPAFYLNSFSVIRQGIAMVILLYGMHYLVKEHSDYKKYMIFAFFAFMFHYVSIVASLAYLLGGSFFNKLHSWIIYLFITLFSLGLSVVNVAQYVLLALPGRFHLYGYHVADVSILKLLVVNALFFFLLFQKEKFVNTKLDRYLFNSMFVGLFIFNTFSHYSDTSRLAQFFLMSEIVLIPIYLSRVKSFLWQKVLLVMFLGYYLFNYNYAIYRDIHTAGYRANFLVPYQNYFFENHKSIRSSNLGAWYTYIQENMEMQKQEQGSQK